MLTFVSCSAYYPKDGYVFNTQTKVQKQFINKVKTKGIDNALEWLKKIQGENEYSFPEKNHFKMERRRISLYCGSF